MRNVPLQRSVLKAMARKKKQLRKKQRVVILGLKECEERTYERQFILKLRHIRNLCETETILSFLPCDEMIECIDELKSLMRKDHTFAIEAYLSHLEALADTAHSKERKQGEGRGMFAKLRAAFGKTKEKPRDQMIRMQEEDVQRNTFSLQKKLTELSGQKSQLTVQFEARVKECANLSADSTEYKIARQQALTLQTRIKNLEKQIETYISVAASNAQYGAVLEAGQITRDVHKFIPDPEKADLLMKIVVDETEETIEDTKNFGSTVTSYSGKMEKVMTSFGSSSPAQEEFDQLVQMKKQENKADREHTVKEKTAESGQVMDNWAEDDSIAEKRSVSDQESQEPMRNEKTEENHNHVEGEFI